MNAYQANPSKNLQAEMPLLGNVATEIIDLPANIVAMCSTEQAAFRLCINQSRIPLSQESIAEHLGLTKGAFNTILNSDHNSRARYLPRVLQNELQRLCRNRAIDQWGELEMKGLLNCQRSIVDRKAELLAELARLDEATQKLAKGA